MLSTVLYYELAMKVPIPVGITVYLLTWGLGHLRCLVIIVVGLELAHGSMIDPFDLPPFMPWTQVSPMMTRPKRNSDNRRVIVNLSYPKYKGVNAGIVKGTYLGLIHTTIYQRPGQRGTEAKYRGTLCAKKLTY